jgi:hypothetical protein
MVGATLFRFLVALGESLPHAPFATAGSSSPPIRMTRDPSHHRICPVVPPDHPSLYPNLPRRDAAAVTMIPLLLKILKSKITNLVKIPILLKIKLTIPLLLLLKIKMTISFLPLLKIRTKAAILFLLKTKTKNLMLCLLGAGLFQIRYDQSPRRRPTYSVYNWPISRLRHEFCRPPSASGLPGRQVFWPISSAMIQVSTTYSCCSAYRLWQSPLPLPGTEYETSRTGLASTRTFLCLKVILTVRVRRRMERWSIEL